MNDSHGAIERFAALVPGLECEVRWDHVWYPATVRAGNSEDEVRLWYWSTGEKETVTRGDFEEGQHTHPMRVSTMVPRSAATDRVQEEGESSLEVVDEEGEEEGGDGDDEEEEKEVEVEVEVVVVEGRRRRRGSWSEMLC